MSYGNHQPSDFNADPAALMRWYVEAGVDETIGDVPIDRFQVAPKPAPVTVAPPQAAAPAPPSGAASSAAMFAPADHPANAVQSVAELKAMVEAFDGCGLKQFASRTV